MRARSVTEAQANRILPALLAGEASAVCVECSGAIQTEAPRPAALLPGSFNPFHEGHGQLAAIAVRLLGCDVDFELSVTNVDKPAIAIEELSRRLAPIVGRARIWLTRAPTFVEKAHLFPQCVFVVGADTAERLLSPRYYGGSATAMLDALDRVREQGCGFLVACRTLPSRPCLELDDLELPQDYLNLFTAIPKSEFHLPLSSTELRAGAR